MKNLSKKIGVGVVASSLVVGGAVSTGLVANAESDFQYIDFQKERKLSLSDRMGDLELLKSVKHNNKYKFKVFGYYLTSTDKKVRLKNDVEELYQWTKHTNDKEKCEQIEGLAQLLENNYKDKETLSYDDIKSIENTFFTKESSRDYSDAREFFNGILKNGISKGIKTVKIGDALAILIFNNDIAPDTSWSGDVSHLIDDKFIEVKSNDKIEVKEEWLGGRLQVQDLEENDYIDILQQPSATIK